MQKIIFEKASFKHERAIFKWLEEPHVKAFWDNSQEHKNDILNFMNGRKEPSNYTEGRYIYWIGSIDDKPYSLIMTIKEELNEARPQIKQDHLSKTGSTYSIDYMIGDKNFFGKGLGARTLETFIAFFRKQFDGSADTFFIDPDISNPRAKHVYEKAGFKYVGDFIMGKDSVFSGRKTCFLVKRMRPKVNIIPAAISDYPIIQNMARFYVYDLSRECGFISENWAIPADGLYESSDFKNYFEETTRKAFIIKVGKELAGFVLLNKAGTSKDTEWNIGEFFILAKFQDSGIGKKVAQRILKMHTGKWEVSVIPENKRALTFWRRVIGHVTSNHYTEKIKTVDYDQHQPKRFIFTFDTS